MENIFILDECEVDKVDEMIEETESIEALFQELIQTKAEYGDYIVYCFYEGKDDFKYYPNKVRAYLEINSISKDVYSQKCGNRDEVIKLYNKIIFDAENIDDDILYFIDRDFYKDNKFNADIYITPCYAIENFYADDKVLERFLETHICINFLSRDKEKEDFIIIRDFYLENLQLELSKQVLINAWYSAQMVKRHEDKYKANKQFSLKKLKDLKKIKLLTSKEQVSEVTKNDLLELTISPYNVSDEEFIKEIEFIQEDLVNNSRGKYVEELLVEIYKKIIDECNKPNNFQINCRTINVHIGDKNFKSHLISSVPIHSSLKKYLDKMLMAN
ncbi:DUF4435 domain-containing protein [Lysinibacillus irui]|uniref:DUF4435 domain-containing protein n=1 Tax=Lysinibacillus irui TaxID=2998077 RepID=UPI003D296D42